MSAANPQAAPPPEDRPIQIADIVGGEQAAEDLLRRAGERIVEEVSKGHHPATLCALLLVEANQPPRFVLTTRPKALEYLAAWRQDPAYGDVVNGITQNILQTPTDGRFIPFCICTQHGGGFLMLTVMQPG